MKLYSLGVIVAVISIAYSCGSRSEKTATAPTYPANKSWEVEGSNYAVTIEQLDSIQYNSARSNRKRDSIVLEKVTDLQRAEAILKDIVEFRKFDGYAGVRRIIFRNGYAQPFVHEEEGFIAYYPSEDILLMEGGHSTDVSYHLGTGRGTEEVGNPDYITAVRDGGYRLNGAYGGQECYSNFVQVKVDGEFQYSFSLSEAFEKVDNLGLCYKTDAFWTDENVFHLRRSVWGDSNIPEYFKVTIHRAEPNPQNLPRLHSKNPLDFIPEGFVLYNDGNETSAEDSGRIQGDLNQDGQEDLVMMIKGTNTEMVIDHETRGPLDRNRRGIIILFKEGDHFRFITHNLTCFSSENEDGGVYFAPDLYFEIENGKLYVRYAHGRYGHWYYTFRYQNNAMEMIGYDIFEHRGPVPQFETSVNFLTKKKLTRENVNRHSQNLEEIYDDTWENIQFEEFTRLEEISDFDRLDREQLYTIH